MKIIILISCVDILSTLLGFNVSGFPSTVVNVNNRKEAPCVRNREMCQIQDKQGSAINKKGGEYGVYNHV